MLCLTAPDVRATARTARAAVTALVAAPTDARQAPERTLLYALVQAHYPDFIARLAAEDRALPENLREEFDAYLRCSALDHGFLRVVCEHCHAERLLAFSCRKRGPSTGSGQASAPAVAHAAWPRVRGIVRRTQDRSAGGGVRPATAAAVGAERSLSAASRQRSRCSLRVRCAFASPLRGSLGPLRFLFASKPDAIGPVLTIVQRVIAGWLDRYAVTAATWHADQTGIERASAQRGAATLIQRFGSALNLEHPQPHAVARRWFRGTHGASAAQTAPAPCPRAHLRAVDAASCPPLCGPAFGCSQSLQAIGSTST